MAEFKVVSDFDLMGDQPEAVDTLAKWHQPCHAVGHG